MIKTSYFLATAAYMVSFQLAVRRLNKSVNIIHKLTTDAVFLSL
jgi:hypothetical protein